MSGTVEVMVGCEPVSHRAGAEVGVVVLHGFTGNPSSMRSVADSMVAAGFDVELPRLPGHGTTIDDMLRTGWDDWMAETERVVGQIARRVGQVVLVGQSMGGTLALAAALAHPEVAALVCINPATQARDETTMAMIDEFIDDGLEVVPGEGSDIADPESFDVAYDGTPLRPIRSLVIDGITPIAGRYSELTMPLRLFTSRQDHVVEPADSEYLVATYGGPVEHSWLERSYHVATLDHDREFVVDETLAFIRTVAS
ncbi:MAG: alpha/beta fold hydrolase [Ilumatobacteraceae bacterium]